MVNAHCSLFLLFIIIIEIDHIGYILKLIYILYLRSELWEIINKIVCTWSIKLRTCKGEGFANVDIKNSPKFLQSISFKATYQINSVKLSF